MTLRTVISGLITAALLVGCEELGLGGLQSEQPNTNIISPSRTISGEIERPDIFRQVGSAVWDGRPTLGGAWVASTETTDLERVKITRIDSGEIITGALFRIEPGTPGPGLVMSSDAAKALGFVAGTPVEIEIVALRDNPVRTPADETSDTTTNTSVATTHLSPQRNDNAQENTVAATQASPPTAPLTTSIPKLIKSRPTASVVSAPAEVSPSANRSGPSDAEVAPGSTPKLSQPLLEIGTFKTEAEADIAMAKLASRGVVTQKNRQRVLFTNRWVVFAGPFNTPEDMVEGRRAAAAAGFSDAIVVIR